MADQSASDGDVSRPASPRPSTPDKTVEGIASDFRKSLWKRASKKYVEKEGNYEYAPIEYDTQIRVLRILPSSQGQEDLVGFMVPCAMSDTHGRKLPSKHELPSIDYCALSYWWGDDKASKKIYLINAENDDLIEQFLEAAKNKKTKLASILSIWKLNSEQPVRHKYIRNNLDSALRHMRKESEIVNVWCDALCIHQEDFIEKAAQIRRMNEVYVNAQSVCIWLGAWLSAEEPAEKDRPAARQKAHEAFKFLNRMLDLDDLDRLVKDVTCVENWWSIYDLMKKEWFNRRWVIQELALASDAHVRLGNEKIDWAKFADSIALFIHKWDQLKLMLESTPQSISGHADRDIKTLEARALGANILVIATSDLFRRSRKGRIQQRLLSLEVLVTSILLPFQASNPKDTIFAVLSLARDTATAETELVLRGSWLKGIQPSMFNRCLNAVLGTISPWIFKSRPQAAIRIDPRITPDYTRPLQDLFAGFMEFCIEQSGSLDILCRHWVPAAAPLTDQQRLNIDKGPDLMMPSWLASIEGHAFGRPRSSARGRENADSLVGGSERGNYYNASYGSKAIVTFGKVNPLPKVTNELNDQDIGTDKAVTTPNMTEPKESPPLYTGILIVCGFKLASIMAITGPVRGGFIPAQALEMGEWPTHKMINGTEKVLSESLWRTLVADRGPDGTSAPKWYRRACERCLVFKDERYNTNRGDGDLDTEFLVSSKNTSEVVKQFLHRVRRVVWKRTFFLAKGPFKDPQDRLFGLAPEKAKDDDLICILLGCTVPVVLRPIKNTSEYKFIGECYVHGMMDGEALRLHPDLWMRHFTLR